MDLPCGARRGGSIHAESRRVGGTGTAGLSSSSKPAAAQLRRVLLAVTVANMLEWYDFAVYAFLAQVIAPIMFPAGNATASLLLSVGTCAVGFLTRPVGAVIFGAVADRHGRKFILLLTFVLMA